MKANANRWARGNGLSTQSPRSRRKQVLFSAAAAAAAGLLVPMQVAHAANGADAWAGNTSSNWADANWSGANNPPITGDSLVFGAAGSSGTTLSDNLMTPGTFSIAGITFNSGASAFVINPATAGTNGFALTGNITNSGTSLETIDDLLSIAATRTVTLTSGGGNVTLGGSISGAGGITTAGAGMLTLSGTDTYTGTTTVANGTTLSFGTSHVLGSNSADLTNASSTFSGGLTISSSSSASSIGVASLAVGGITGSLASGSTVTVNSGGTLLANGSGVIAGPVNVNAGGAVGGTGTLSGLLTLATGSTSASQGEINLTSNSTGTLNVTNAAGLTLGGTSDNAAAIDLNAGNRVAVAGALTVNAGGASIYVTPGTAVANTSYTLMTFGSGTGSGFATVAAPPRSDRLFWRTRP